MKSSVNYELIDCELKFVLLWYNINWVEWYYVYFKIGKLDMGIVVDFVNGFEGY